MKTSKILRAAICALLFNTGATFAVSPIAAPPKVIIDTDFNTIGDDGQVAVMAAQLYAQGTIDLLGFTVASGNEWRDQEVAECLKAVERLGIENRVKVYVGSQCLLEPATNSEPAGAAAGWLCAPDSARL
jgi:inosine-uridine nucleoside N-ribohydrolase